MVVSLDISDIDKNYARKMKSLVLVEDAINGERNRQQAPAYGDPSG
jgi:hypothetical protein